MIVLCIAAFVVLIISPLARLIVTHLHLIGIYSVVDLINYIKYKKWDEFNLYGIQMYVGMFGHGKTLSMAHRAYLIHNKFGDRIRFISNFHLNDIPYIPLINFNQLVDLGEEEDHKYDGTVVLIDEIENVLSHRNFANFPLELIHVLTQQRKKKVFILCSAQRFHMVDKLWRSITDYVIDCNKFWRFQHCEVFDAWDLENAVNRDILRRKQNIWWFVKNQDYNCYDTSEMIKKHTAEDFISNDQTLVRKGMDLVVNDKAVRSSHLKKRSRVNAKKGNSSN